MSNGLVAETAGISLYAPAWYDVAWGAVALLVPLVALAVLYLVVRLATRHGSASASDGAPQPGYRRAGHPNAEAARRHGALVAGTAWVLAAVLPQVVLTVAAPFLVIAAPAYAPSGSVPASGAVLVGLAPALPGLTYLAVHAVGERTWPRAHGSVRRASLAPRSVRGVTPRWLRRITAAWAIALAATLATCAAVAQDGVRLVATVGVSVRTTSPFPGAFYGVPIAIGIAVVLVGTGLVLRRVARRPAALPDDPAYDDASRLLSGHRVLRGTQLVVGWSLAGVLAVAGVALRAVELDVLGTAVLVVATLVGLASLAVALVPGRAPVPTSVRLPHPGASVVGASPSLPQESA